jgi:hypothetical protein
MPYGSMRIEVEPDTTYVSVHTVEGNPTVLHDLGTNAYMPAPASWDRLIIARAPAPEHGTLTLDPDNECFTFEPAEGFTGHTSAELAFEFGPLTTQPFTLDFRAAETPHPPERLVVWPRAARAAGRAWQHRGVDGLGLRPAHQRVAHVRLAHRRPRRHPRPRSGR